MPSSDVCREQLDPLSFLFTRSDKRRSLDFEGMWFDDPGEASFAPVTNVSLLPFSNIGN